MNEKIVVIGSNSFSGASFVDYCLRCGYEVIGMSRSKEPNNAFLPYRWDVELQKKFKFIQLDLNHDIEAMAEVISDCAAPYVFNFAAQSMVAQSWEKPQHWYQTNVVANVLLHDKLRKIGSMRKYVHVSTPEVYGNCSGTVKEDNPFNPTTPYAASRAACDLHLKTFFNHYKFPVVFTRAANVYGPGQQLYRIIPRTILFIKMGNKLQLHGGGHSTRSFIHIRDVSEATLKVALEGIPGATYHISTTRFVSIRELVEMICSMMNAQFSKVVDVVDERPGKDAAYLLDSSLLKQSLNWQDKISLEEGIKETIDWVEKNYEVLKREPLDYIHKP